MDDAWVLPALPVASFVILLLVSQYLPRKGDFIAIAAIHSLVAWYDHESIWAFAGLQSAMMFCFGFVGANFNSIAMEPLGHVAGYAAHRTVAPITGVPSASVTRVFSVNSWALGALSPSKRYGSPSGLPLEASACSRKRYLCPSMRSTLY